MKDLNLNLKLVNESGFLLPVLEIVNRIKILTPLKILSSKNYNVIIYEESTKLYHHFLGDGNKIIYDKALKYCL